MCKLIYDNLFTSLFHLDDDVFRMRLCVSFADSLTFDAQISDENERISMNANEYQKNTSSKVNFPFALIINL
jgi:hypothetical protein